MSLRYLLVEDSHKISDGIAEFFEGKSGGLITIDRAFDGEQGLRFIDDNTYDLIIIDIMLPGPSGFEIIKKIRKRGDTPVFFLTSLGNEDSILKGYELGADDYIVKPFNVKELYAKAEAMVKRYRGDHRFKVIRIGNIELDPYAMEVFSSGTKVDLTPKEYFLLKLLMDNPRMVFSRDKLLDFVWGADFEGGARVVDNHIRKLRKLLGSNGKQIVTVFARGYKLEKGDE